MADDGAFPAKTLKDWARLAQAELRGRPIDSLDWMTPEDQRKVMRDNLGSLLAV